MTFRSNKPFRWMLPLIAATAIAVPVVAVTAPSAEAASWVCVYRYNSSGAKIGSACFSGRTARTCDLKVDTVGIYGVFGVRGQGAYTLGDPNGGKKKCGYRTFANYVTSAYVR